MCDTVPLQLVMAVTKCKDCDYQCLVQAKTVRQAVVFLMVERYLQVQWRRPKCRRWQARVKQPHHLFSGEGLPPIPAKLVAKIQRGDFVDMAELLSGKTQSEGGWGKLLLPWVTVVTKPS